MDFILIHPDGLRSVWPDVRTGLAKMPPEDWIAEDVYHAIKAGAAALYLAVGDAGFAGFMVLERTTADYSREPALHCWLAYNHEDQVPHQLVLDFLRSQAAQMGVKRITFASPRPGWAKRFKCLSAVYEIPLED